MHKKRALKAAVTATKGQTELQRAPITKDIQNVIPINDAIIMPRLIRL